MKSLQYLALALAALGARIAAFANDGGVYAIEVKGINPEQGGVEGTRIEFTGSEAKFLAARLPNGISVAPGVEFAYKNLAIYSKAWTIYIGCQVANALDGEFNPINITLLDKPICTISLTQYSEDNFTAFPGGMTGYALKEQVTDYKVDPFKITKTNPGLKILFYGRKASQILSILPSAYTGEDGDARNAEIRIQASNGTLTLGYDAKKAEGYLTLE